MLVLAHRGASLCPEIPNPPFAKPLNSAPTAWSWTFISAKDGQMVVNHNFDVDHNSNGLGLIEEYT